MRRSRPQYNATHQRTSRALRAAHVARYGWWCPGEAEAEEAHESHDLVADHIVPGHPEMGYRVVCRKLNQWYAHGSSLTA